MEQKKSSIKLIVESNFANKECKELIQIAANSEKKIEILEEKKIYVSNKLTEALSVKTYFTPLRQLSYNADLTVLQEKINALKNYKELQNKFKELTDDNKKLKLYGQNNKLYVQNKSRFFSKSKDDELKVKKNLFVKHIRKFIEILNKETVHTGLSIDQKTKKSDANERIVEFKLKEILNNFGKERLAKDQDVAWLMRETKFAHKKKTELIQIATKYKEKLDLLEKEVNYVIDTLRK
ncbi:3753_t:CDS:1, partial [Racocetra persica]